MAKFELKLKHMNKAQIRKVNKLEMPATRGPWHYEHMPERREPEFSILCAEENIATCPDLCVANISYQSGLGDDGYMSEAERFSTAKANARLMAAAPELLQALKDMVRMASFEGQSNAVLSAARQAIRKAEGK